MDNQIEGHPVRTNKVGQTATLVELLLDGSVSRVRISPSLNSYTEVFPKILHIGELRTPHLSYLDS